MSFKRSVYLNSNNICIEDTIFSTTTRSSYTAKGGIPVIPK